MDYEAEIATLKQQVDELQKMLASKTLLEETVPRSVAPYDDGTVSSADGVVPMLINGVRYDVLVNET